MSTNGIRRAITSAPVIFTVLLSSVAVQAYDLKKPLNGGVHIIQQAVKDGGNGLKAVSSAISTVHVQGGVSGSGGSGEQMNPDAQPNPNGPSGNQPTAALLPVFLPLQIIVPAKDLPRPQTPAAGPTIENLDAGTKPYPQDADCGGMNCLGPGDQPQNDLPNPNEIVRPDRIPVGGPAEMEAP